MPLTRRSRSREAIEEWMERIQSEVSAMRQQLSARLDQMTEAIDSRRADDEVEATAAERVRSGAAERTEDGAEALRDLGVRPR
jgi:glutathione S-transferase